MTSHTLRPPAVRLAEHEAELRKLNETPSAPGDAFEALLRRGSIEYHAECIRFLKRLAGGT